MATLARRGSKLRSLLRACGGDSWMMGDSAPFSGACAEAQPPPCQKKACINELLTNAERAHLWLPHTGTIISSRLLCKSAARGGLHRRNLGLNGPPVICSTCRILAHVGAPSPSYSACRASGKPKAIPGPPRAAGDPNKVGDRRSLLSRSRSSVSPPLTSDSRRRFLGRLPSYIVMPLARHWLRALMDTVHQVTTL